MIRNAVDVATRVSPELSEFIAQRVFDPDNETAVTLGAVRAHLSRALSPEEKEVEHMHYFDLEPSLLDELDALIGEHGGAALAADFIAAEASESLSRVIEALLDDENRENPPTLQTLKEAMADGLVARLVGEGVLEDDEDETLFSETDELIRRFGNDFLAEGFLRYD